MFHLKKHYRWVISIVLIFLSSHFSFAQCPNNLDFESGNLTSWRSYVDSTGCSSVCGNVFLQCPIGCTSASISPCTYKGVNTPILNRIQVVSGAGLDPYSGLPISCPFPGYGSFALKLGDDQTGSESEKIKSQFVVTAGNSNLVYRFAAVMNDASPAHDSCVKSKIVFNAYDYGPVSNLYATPIDIPCGSVFLKVPDPTNIPNGWFLSPQSTATQPILCSNWLPVALNLTPVIGHLVSLEFSTYDCGGGVHFGYAYVDITCQQFTLTSAYCKDNKTATLVAPAGFADYIWDTAGTGPPVIGHSLSNSFTLPTPSAGTVYSVSLIPFSSPSCSLVVSDTIHLYPQPTAKFSIRSDSLACGIVRFFDSSRTNLPNSVITSWHWDFGDGASANNTSGLQNPTHVYNKPGTYSVSLYTMSDLNCSSDTFILSIPIAPSPLMAGFRFQSDSFECSIVSFFDTSKTHISYSNVNGWQWIFGDLNSGANNLSNLKNPNHIFRKPGAYHVLLVVTTDLGCKSDTIRKTIIIKPLPYDVDAGKDTVFCKNSSVALSATYNFSIPNLTFFWSNDSFITDVNSLTPYVFPKSTQYYYFNVQTSGGCASTDSVLVRVSEPYLINLIDSTDPTCLGRSVQLSYLPPSNEKKYTIIWYSHNPDAHFSCNNCFDPVYKSLKSGYVYANSYNEYGCVSMDSMWVPYVECPEIVVPTAFTPNGDKTNDNFFLLYKNFTKLNFFEVYNRWGELIFETTDLNSLGWDGTFKGKEQETGVFVFKIMVTDKDGNIKKMNGNVTLIR